MGRLPRLSHQAGVYTQLFPRALFLAILIYCLNETLDEMKTVDDINREAQTDLRERVKELSCLTTSLTCQSERHYND